MNQAKIVLLCVAGAIIYGVLHDQVTARLCIEYFTVAHPPLFPTVTSPTLIALCWGVTATLGIGLVLGVLLALAAQSGSEPPLPASQLLAPIARLLATMAVAAFGADVSGFFLAERGVISIPADFAEAIPLARHHQFMAVWFAHGASYFVGLVGGASIVFRVWRARGRPVFISLLPHSPAEVCIAMILVMIAAYVFWIRFAAN
jgi:hypothetical protein